MNPLVNVMDCNGTHLRVGEIGAGFDESKSRNIGCAGDVESELIVLYTKVRLARLDLWVPYYPRIAFGGGKVAPACGPRQIIHSPVGPAQLVCVPQTALEWADYP